MKQNFFKYFAKTNFQEVNEIIQLCLDNNQIKLKE